MGIILNGFDNHCQTGGHYDRGMLVVNRFHVPEHEAVPFRTRLESAHAVLARQKGYVDGQLGRNVDDPTLWVLSTRWQGPGAYRRALSASEVKLEAWALLGQALDEPSAFEILRPGDRANRALPRETP